MFGGVSYTSTRMCVCAGILFVCMCGLVCVSWEVLGDEGQRIKFYGHILYMNFAVEQYCLSG